jgi:hypothetical protein
MKVTGYKSKRESFGGRRGIIRTFTQASRRRLMRFMARLKVRKIRATFLTLTFTEMVSHERARIVFKRFAMRLRRAFKKASCVWRLEYQPKRGAIHYHLICFNLPYWEQAEVQRCWEACTEEHMSIVDIRLIHGARSIMGYVSKYIAKVDNEPTSLDDGAYQHGEEKEPAASRFWGYINKELLPLGEVITGVLTDRQTIKSLSSLAWAILRNDNPYNSLSFHLFCDNARWLCERAIEEGGALLDEWEYTVKDHSSPRATHSPYTEHFSEPELALKPALSLGRLSKGERSEACTPLTKDWTKRASFSFPARMASEFRNDGIIVHIVPYSKEQKHAAL